MDVKEVVILVHNFTDRHPDLRVPSTLWPSIKIPLTCIPSTDHPPICLIATNKDPCPAGLPGRFPTIRYNTRPLHRRDSINSPLALRYEIIGLGLHSSIQEPGRTLTRYRQIFAYNYMYTLCAGVERVLANVATREADLGLPSLAYFVRPRPSGETTS